MILGGLTKHILKLRANGSICTGQWIHKVIPLTSLYSSFSLYLNFFLSLSQFHLSCGFSLGRPVEVCGALTTEVVESPLDVSPSCTHTLTKIPNIRITIK